MAKLLPISANAELLYVLDDKVMITWTVVNGVRVDWWFCDVDLMRRQEELNRLEEKTKMEIQRRMEMR